MKNCFKKLVIVVTSLVFITGFAVGTSLAADVIKLGVAGAHSGDLASYGLPSVKAAELVVNEINAKGGILGKKVVLLLKTTRVNLSWDRMLPRS